MWYMSRCLSSRCTSRSRIIWFRQYGWKDYTAFISFQSHSKSAKLDITALKAKYIIKREGVCMEENDEEVKKTSKKGTIFNFILIITIFAGLLIYMINVDGIDNIINLLHQVNYNWVIAGLICLIIYWICEAITLHVPLKRMYKSQNFGNSVKVSMIGQLFNNITPFSSGGQPMQAYELTKTGKRVSDSLSVLMLKFIVTQIALVVTTVIIVFAEFDFFKMLMHDYLWVAILGFGVNIVAIIVAIIAGINKKLITSIVNPIIKLLGKIHIFKQPDEVIDNFDKSMDNFSGQFKVMKSEKLMVLKMFVVAVIQSMSYYSITYMVYKAFGNSEITFLQIIPAQAFLLLIMTFVPTPGSGLGAEGGFYLLFNSIFKKGTINMSILFWRIYTFYLPIIVGALFLIPIKAKKVKKETN